MNDTRRGQKKPDGINEAFISSPLVLGFCLVASGVALREYLSGVLPYAGIILIVALLMAIEFYRGRLAKQKALVWLACMSLVLSGMLLHAMKMQQVKIQEDRCPAGQHWQPVHLRGYVVSTPRFRPDQSPSSNVSSLEDPSKAERWLTAVDVRYVALLSQAGENEQRVESQGIVTVVIPGKHRDLIPGDQVDCFVKWRRIPAPSNPGEMDFAERLYQQGIFAQAKAKNIQQIKKVGWPQYWNPNRYLGKLAMAGDRAMEQYVPFDQAPLASALVLGQRGQIEWKLSESLLETGTIHMLAISGMHVEMVAVSVGVLCLLLRMPQRSILIVVSLVVVGYTFLCGANAPVLRAMFAVLLVSFARYFGLKTQPYNLLSLAALSVIALRTDHLWDTGTQLSFLAVAVLIYIANEKRKQVKQVVDPLDELLQSTDTWWQAQRRKLTSLSKDSLYVSTWVWIVTTPIVLYTFHVISPVAILMNLLLLVPLWIGLLSGLGVLVFGPFSSLIGSILGFFCGASLLVTEQAIQLVAKLPLSHWWLPSPPTWWLTCFYVLLACLILLRWLRRCSSRAILQVLSIYLLLGCMPWHWIVHREALDRWYYFETPEPQGLVLTFIDVGHGTSVVVQLPSGEVWLYDAGKMGDPNRAFYPIASTLWHLRLRSIDKLFISHADADHFNAVPGILKRFDVREIYTTSQLMTSMDPAVKELLLAIDHAHVPVHQLSAGVQWSSGETKATILHPIRDMEFGSDNADSLSVLLEYQQFKVLLPGDLEGRGVNRLLREPPIYVDVLMAPHHGSLAESPEPLLGWSHAKNVVISGGARANRSEVFRAYSSHGVRDVWITDRDNALRVAMHREGTLEVKRWLDRQWNPALADAKRTQNIEEDDASSDDAF